ncbi:TetR family transcriptional regulator [Amycolatopsis acidiphila]|uniref:TetR family transcriptional regulator n=1 Tax=Amycolatopsis acidiphila TaxID=715473 RepID=A0A558AP94_9PSEU|nr:TetR family transcriptional regulator [Amycolatopsis acidiphila]TVT26066.1 TetR family transcriptional regulator [Amycolatopsis acidiphila]UIJ63211.1 TetR family transcriptional regulator [Amycolatopsis acidiphila]GHG74371.1 TetR family transcriptional regulator [Amycolatopsis acidiphila]
MTDDLGRREQKKLATRRALADAALRLCVEKGFDQVTVEQITHEAGVSLRTFFNYFSGKEDAVVAGDAATAEALVAAFARRPTGEPVLTALHAAITEVLPAHIDRTQANQRRALRRIPALLPHQLAAFAAYEQQLAEAVAGRMNTDTDTDPYPATLAAAVLACLRVAVQRWLDASSSADRPSLAKSVDAMLTLLAEGFDTR